MRFTPACFVATIVASFLTSVPLSAVQPSGGETTSTASWAPEQTTPWDYVGSIGQASGIFLGGTGGSYWVLTAAHVGVGSGIFRLGDHDYTAVNGSLVQLEGVFGESLPPDLVLFRVDAGSGAKQDYLDALPLLELGETSLTIGTDVRMIGYGDLNGTTAIKSWGDNSIAGGGYFDVLHAGKTYRSASYYTLDSEGVRAVTGDSGGGAFYWTGTGWALGGVMNAIAADINGEGAGTAVIALSVYADQILAVVPEPGTLAALGALLAFASVLAIRRRPCLGHA